MPEYGQAFALWREAACQSDTDTWHAYTCHPFVKGLQEGTLPPEAYLRYLKQDYLFLLHFSRAWALAVVKSETLDEMKFASATVDALVNLEMQHHVDICAGYGIEEQTLLETEESAATIAYTRYVLDAGLSGDLLDLLAALAPCIFGYGEIGRRLGKGLSTENPYAEWIETYAGTAYQKVCHEVGHLIDEALIRRVGRDFSPSPRWERLTHRFVTASKLEVDFWGMALQ